MANIRSRLERQIARGVSGEANNSRSIGRQISGTSSTVSGGALTGSAGRGGVVGANLVLDPNIDNGNPKPIPEGWPFIPFHPVLGVPNGPWYVML